jgi:ectoine hydroxylase-related dioxygenase (phytanoyl-CoA dioxygenase family)
MPPHSTINIFRFIAKFGVTSIDHPPEVAKPNAMKHPTQLEEMRAFNEDDYRALYPDVAKNIELGAPITAWEHYERHGRREGRLICSFDEKFYLSAYKIVRRELALGYASSAYHHYIMFGRARGYLPRKSASRPRNPTATSSAFGGLWIDAADALDRVRGRLETGQITAAQAVALESFINDGYIVLRNAVPEKLIKPAEAELDRAYRGEFPNLNFECGSLDPNNPKWQPVVVDVPAKTLDMHYFSEPIRELIFSPNLTEFLALIFENKVLVSQSLGFLRGSAQSSHQDTAYVPFTSACSFVASWIALEDVTAGAGELYYYKGSHRLPEFFYDGKYKSVFEGGRFNGANEAGPFSRAHYANQINSHLQSLDANAARFGLERQVLMAKRGDVLIWHADLIHGGQPISRSNTRKSIVTHYCPKHFAPLFCEARDLSFVEYKGHAYTSSHYVAAPAPT